MFTKNDYRDYFDALSLKTRAMIYNVYDIIYSLKDEKMVTMFKAIARDEMQNYDMIRWISDTLSLEEKAALEKRRYKRETKFGNVKMIRVGAYTQIKARCMNVSMSGMCIELGEKVEVSDSYEFVVDFYEKEQSVHLFGRVMWVKQVNPLPHIAGIQYRVGVQFKM
jgi:hypothetical protein